MDATAAVHVLSSPMGGFSLPDDAFRSVSLAVAGKVLEAMAGESGNGVCLIDGRTWRVGWRNQAFSRLLRLTASDPAWADGQALFEGFSSELLEEARRAMSVRNGATATGCAWRGIRFRIRISPFTAGEGPADLLAEFFQEALEDDGRGGAAGGASATVADDAADLAAENRSLRRRLAELEAVTALLPVGIGIAADRDCRSVRANSRLSDALGMADGDGVRLSGAFDASDGRAMVHRDGRELGPAVELLQQAARDGIEIRGHDVEVSRADGRSVRLVGFAAPVHDEAGEIRGAAGAFLDVTERRVAEEELARSRRLFERIAEATPGILQLEDLIEKRTVYTNGLGPRMLGYPAERGGPVPWDWSVGLVHPEDRARFEEFRDAVGGLTDEDVLEAEFRMRHADGSYRWLCSRAAVFSRLPDGRPDRVVCLAHDVTDARRNQDELHEIREELEERVRARTAELERKARELERSNAELQQFANVASHDLQEPLRTVVSYTQFLAKRYRGQLDPAADEYIGYIVEGCLRMQRLIQDLLAYARIGARGSHLRSVSADQCLREAMDNLSEIMARHGAQVQWDALPVVRADPGQLVQVFQNLLENSVKFARETPPRIRVSARPQPGEWLFQVEDNGIGMEPHYLQRIFLIFQRLHARSQYPGSGIGLSICKKIVEQHGGRIWAESARDVGSVFHFTLPDATD